MIKANVDRLARLYGFETPDDPVEWTERIVPYRMAPTIVWENGNKKIKAMQFSMVPGWSKEPRVKFATHNARLDTVDSKPTWKRPFQNNHCLVPIDAFIEPIYEGDFAGHMVAFSPKKEHTLFAAGIYDSWVDKKTGEVLDSFAILTGDPVPFVEEIGHDRTPVFITKKAWDPWLAKEKKSPDELKKLLQENIEECEFEVEKDRAMKPGWEKRK